MEDLQIFIVTHKPIIVPDDPFYVPIQAGSIASPSFGIQADCTGDNISRLNPFYSELTAHYWIWKNTSSRYVGLVHYRRHFSPKKDGRHYLGKRIARGGDLLESLGRKNFIAVEPFSFFFPQTVIPQSLEQQYVHVHGFELHQARRAVADASSQYLDSFDFVMRNNKLYAFNLMVTSREIFNSYMDWLFRVYAVLDELLSPNIEDGYQARIQAFISERLLTTWISRNRKLLDIEHRGFVYFGGL